MVTWLSARKATALGAPLVALLLLAGVALAANTVVDLDNGPQTSNCGGGTVTWHFVLNQTDDGTTLIDFEATFQTAGTVTAWTSESNPAVIHIFVTTTGDDTLLDALATITEQDDPTKPKLVLSDFRCAPFATKEGHKFHDLNANSIWDVGEPGLQNWTIQAWQGATLVASTSTDATGYYKFTLSPGSYSIKEVCPAGAGWRQSFPTPITTAANCGANDYDITLVAGQTDSGNDFGNFKNATKSGSKFHDLNANSVWDAGEPGLAGWTIEARQGATLVASTTTAANGSYSFSLTPGSYTIKEVCPAGAGWRQSFPTPITSAANCGANVYEITLTSDQTDSGNDFGNFQNAVKSGSKFHDLNANSIWDAGEPGLPNWTIQAWQGGAVVATTVTDANGDYSFSLTPGAYVIKEVCPAGWRQSYPAPITSAANCGANTHNITLTSGQVDADNDFGNFQNAVKSGSKFHDINENGVWDGIEPALAGWEIHLFGTGADGAIDLVTTTNASGAYSFSVAPGSYTVCEILKVDWSQTYPNAGTTGAADCTGHTHGGTLTPGPWGWGITLTSGQQDTNNHFGNKFRFEGCTPGYWKVEQHHDSWAPTGYTTGQTLESVFDVPDTYGLDSKTLLEALNFKGGSTLSGAAQILLRAAVAALLNSAHPDVNYQYTTAQVINMVNAALASQNRSTMLTLATQLDTANNAGCTLN